MTQINPYTSRQPIPDNALQAGDMGGAQVGRAIENFGNTVQDVNAKLLTAKRNATMLDVNARSTRALLDGQYQALQEHDPKKMEDVYLASTGAFRESMTEELGSDKVLLNEFNARFTSEQAVYQHSINRHALELTKVDGLGAFEASRVTLAESYATASNDAQRQAVVSAWNEQKTRAANSVATPGQVELADAEFQRTVRAGVAKQSIENTSSTVNQVLDAANDAHLQLDGGIDFTHLGPVLTASRDKMQRAGVHPEVADKVIAESVAHSAVRNLNLDMLKALDGIKTGAGEPLSATEAGQDAIYKAGERITAKIMSTDTLAHRNDTRIKQEKTDAIYYQAVDKLQKYGGDTSLYEELDALGKVNPEKVKSLMELQDAYQGREVKTTTNPAVYADLMKRIYTDNVSVEEITDMGTPGPERNALLSRSDMESALALQRSIGDRKDPRLSDPAFTHMQYAIGDAIKGGDMFWKDPKNLYNANVFEVEWQQLANGFLKQNPNATPAELSEYMQKNHFDRLRQKYLPELKDKDVKAIEKVAPPNVSQRLSDPRQSPVQSQHVIFTSPEQLKTAMQQYMAVDGHGVRTPAGPLWDAQRLMGLDDAGMREFVARQQAAVGGKESKK